MKQDEKQPKVSKRLAYEAPQIIYENQVTTRAGSPLSNPSSVDDIDPADLFGE
jgi:hypothetical protein